jgi:tetratricopeptide (TPR) repeat protein
MSSILDRVKDLPNGVKGIIGLVTTIVPAVVLLRNNFSLGVVVVSGIVTASAFSALCYLAFAKNDPVAGFSPRRSQVYRYQRYRSWAIAGICVIILAVGTTFVFKPTRYYIRAALKGVELAPHAEILITTFTAPVPQPFDIPKRIRANLNDELAKYGLKEVGVEVTSQSVKSDEEARELADQSGSKVLIWGSYDSEGITINIYTPEPPMPGDTALQMKEVPWAKGPQASSEMSFQIRQQLPNDISFLSLFIIGSLEYQKNEYQKGHQAFDAAMANVPKGIGLKNESLLHFFAARELGASDNKTFARAVCEYSKAIELDATFFAAYNNLGILITRHLLDAQSEEDTDPSQSEDVIRQCLIKAGYKDENVDENNPDVLFQKALEYQPESAVIKFNRVAAKWNLASVFDIDDPDKRSELGQMMDDLLSKDQSIPGAHILRGVLAFESYGKNFDDNQFQIARREFAAASRLIPKSFELHINIGRVLMRKKHYAEAKSEFEESLSLSRDTEAYLALADVDLRQGQPALALQRLDGIPSNCKECASASQMAAILRSRISFEAGDLPKAIGVLEDNLAQRRDPKTTEPKAENSDDLNSFTQYLLGLLYTLKADAKGADAHFMECIGPNPRNDYSNSPVLDGLTRQALSYNETATAAWYEVVSECLPTDRNPSGWERTRQCLRGSKDVSQRLKKLFDIAQDEIAYRIFYQRKVEFAGLG